jgi:hypothetical protein
MSSFLLGWEWHQIVIVTGLFLTLLTILTHQINLNAAKQKGRAIITPYLISIVLKLVLSGGFLFALVKVYPEMAMVLVLSFLIFYATFSALEIILVNRRLNSKKF